MKSIQTNRFFLRPTSEADVSNVAATLQCASIKDIESLLVVLGNAGCIWSIESAGKSLGYVIAHNIHTKPIIKLYLNVNQQEAFYGIGGEVISAVSAYIASEAERPIKNKEHTRFVDKVLQRTPQTLYIAGQYCMALSELKDVVERAVSTAKDNERQRVLAELVSAFRDNALMLWLQYLSDCGDGQAFDLHYSLRKIAIEAGDNFVQTKLVKFIAGLDYQTANLASNIRLLANAEIETPDGEFAVNVYQPIHLARPYESIIITLHFEILNNCHDSILVALENDAKPVSLAEKGKRQPVKFEVSIGGTIHKDIAVSMDETQSHTIRFQSFPPLDWTEEDCLSQGVLSLYKQQYSKARLCFEKYDIAESAFWQGIMQYISADAEVAASHFYNCAEDTNTAWEEAACAMLAVMKIKGEGVCRDLQMAKTLTAVDSEDSCIAFLREAIEGKLPSEVFDQYLYAYNVTDRAVKPIHYLTFEGKSLAPFHLTNPRRPIIIEVPESLIGDRIDRANDNLYAYIGVTTKNGEWQYVSEGEWYDNSERNKFVYDEENKLWRLRIDDLYKIKGILDFDQVRQLNIILRNNLVEKEIVIKPSDDSYFIIDCLTEPRHIALCNITPFLMKMAAVRDTLSRLGIRCEKIM